MRICDWSSDVCSSDLAEQELLGRPKRLCRMTDRAKQALKGFAHGGVVIDDKDDGLLRAHWTPLSVGEAPSSLSGSVNRKMVPFGTFSVTDSLPPWTSLIARPTMRPKPTPYDFVVTKPNNTPTLYYY